jgi:tetratricopeptide (TPR) repeat protein
LSQLARADRINRKQLKEDALVTFMGRMGAKIQANANLVIGGVLALVVIIVLLVFWSRGRSERSTEANVRAEASVGAFSVGEYETSLQMADGVMASYPGSRAAVLAAYVSGQSNLQLGNFIAAEQSFQRYLDGVDKEPFYENSARRGLAASLEGQQRFREAAAIYLQAADAVSGQLAEETRIDAARCWRLAGDFDQAERLLQQVAAGDDVLASRASLELAVVEALRNATQPKPTGTTAEETETSSSEATP